MTRVVPGAQLTLASPNGGACCLVAARAGATVIAACLRNASAVGRGARDLGAVTVVAAGERWPEGACPPRWRT